MSIELKSLRKMIENKASNYVIGCHDSVLNTTHSMSGNETSDKNLNCFTKTPLLIVGSIAALGSLRALGTIGTLGTLGTLGALCTLGSLGTLAALGALGALVALG